ncbi:MAG: I78 family peptidase inhibitor [Pseudomonadota bacterium]
MIRCKIIACCVIAGCTIDPSDIPGEQRCGAESFEYLLGEPAEILSEVTLPSFSRILRPDDVITLDFSPDRLTIDIDDLGFVASVSCR